MGVDEVGVLLRGWVVADRAIQALLMVMAHNPRPRVDVVRPKACKFACAVYIRGCVCACCIVVCGVLQLPPITIGSVTSGQFHAYISAAESTRQISREINANHNCGDEKYEGAPALPM